MIFGAGVLAIGTAAGALVFVFEGLLVLWFVLGLGYSLTMTPVGRLLRRSSAPEIRPALFAAQFALSHACWLLTYPLAGWLGASLGFAPAFILMSLLAAVGVALCLRLWPAQEPRATAQ